MKLSTFSYEKFIETTVQGINKKYQTAEHSLFELAQYVKEKVEEGVKYGKSKEQVYRDLSKHPDFKLKPQWIKQYDLTAKFIERTGRSTDQFSVPFSAVQKVVEAKLDDADKKIILKVAEDKKMSQREIREEIRSFQKEKRLEIAEAKGKKTKLPESAELIHGDFRKTKIEENSIDLILTDPPYPEEFLPLWSDLSAFAYKVLKPSAFLVCYSGQMYLPEVFAALSSKLIYYWTFTLFHRGATQVVQGRNIMCRWKPILIFQKPPFKKLSFVTGDYVESEQREKGEHNWQQSQSGATKLLEIFSSPGDTILDPFCGAGTFPFVAHKMKRKAIGIEIDKKYFNISKAKFYAKPN